MVKKIFGYIVIICLFAGSIAGIYFGIRFAQVSNELKSDAEYIEQIDDLQLELSQVNDSLTEANNKYSLLVTENEQNKQTIADYTVLISEKDTQIQTLEGEKQSLLSQIEDLNEEHLSKVEELNSQISTLTSEKNDLLSDIEALEEEIEANETVIAQYESQILTLQNEVTRLTGLLEGYEDIKNGTFEVSFYDGEVLVATRVATNGKTVTDVPTYSKEGYDFDGWALSSTPNVVCDVSGYAVTENTTFVAVLTELHSVSFESVSGSVDSQIIRHGEYVSTDLLEDVSSLEDFKGWALSTNLNELVDLSSYAITSDVTFVAVFKEWTTIYGAETSLVGVSTLNVSGINPGDKFRVTLSNLSVVRHMPSPFNYDMYYSFNKDGAGYVASASIDTQTFDNAYEFTVDLDSPVSLSFISDGKVTISVSCSSSDVVSFNVSVSDKNFSLNSLHLMSIEVFK